MVVRIQNGSVLLRDQAVATSSGCCCGCPPGKTKCASNCCTQEQTCCSGSCCDNVCCNGVCCQQGQYCCNGVCTTAPCNCVVPGRFLIDLVSPAGASGPPPCSPLPFTQSNPSSPQCGDTAINENYETVAVNVIDPFTSIRTLAYERVSSGATFIPSIPGAYDQFDSRLFWSVKLVANVAGLTVGIQASASATVTERPGSFFYEYSESRLGSIFIPFSRCAVVAPSNCTDPSSTQQQFIFDSPVGISANFDAINGTTAWSLIESGCRASIFTSSCNHPIYQSPKGCVNILKQVPFSVLISSITSYSPLP